MTKKKSSNNNSTKKRSTKKKSPKKKLPKKKSPKKKSQKERIMTLKNISLARFKLRTVKIEGEKFVEVSDTKYRHKYLFEAIKNCDYAAFYKWDTKIMYLFNLHFNDTQNIKLKRKEISNLQKWIDENINKDNMYKALFKYRYKKSIEINDKKISEIDSFQETFYSCFKFNVKKAQKYIKKVLNPQLQKKCPELSIKLELWDSLYYNLLLIYKEKEISSIGLAIRNFNIIIGSNTNKEYRGKKYNKFLRAVTILLAASTLILCDNDPLKNLKSVAINPRSVWLLLSNFNDIKYVPENPKHFKELIQMLKKGVKVRTKNNKLSKDFIKLLYFQTNLDIYVPLNKTNKLKAQKLIDTLLDENSKDNVLICP